MFYWRRLVVSRTKPAFLLTGGVTRLRGWYRDGLGLIIQRNITSELLFCHTLKRVKVYPQLGETSNFGRKTTKKGSSAVFLTGWRINEPLTQLASQCLAVVANYVVSYSSGKLAFAL